ncbi:hypothetical protein M3Y99_01981000 [Aphelenchoides fujianensis]|nr:hypothetical protein M3Y99_01981000 [Aphelenchoides fujianensis]
MRSEWSFHFLLVLLSTHGPFVHSLVCYSCTAQLASNVDESSQVAMRLFLENTYQIPPVHRYCALEKDVEFKTVPTAQCANSDKCVKLSAEGQGLHFVIRGCESHIYKPNVGVQDAVCRSTGSPSLCYCTENLCNAGERRWTCLSLLLFTLATAFFLLPLLH